MAPNLLQLYNKLSKYPFGNYITSLAFGLYAPYFLNLRALVILYLFFIFILLIAIIIYCNIFIIFKDTFSISRS